ncbi:MAG TPA: Mov34/MPN/PAD-1 family protein, partial [Rubricoccaceae bacterium]
FVSADHRFVVRVSPEAYRDLVTTAQDGLPNETGGLLLGSYSGRHTVLTVRAALPPPPDSVRRRRTFIRGTAGTEHLLGGTSVQGYPCVVVGEWHSHPGSSPSPSNTDHCHMTLAAVRRLYGCSSPVLVIVGGDLVDPDGWSATVYRRWHRPTTAVRGW